MRILPVYDDAIHVIRTDDVSVQVSSSVSLHIANPFLVNSVNNLFDMLNTIEVSSSVSLHKANPFILNSACSLFHMCKNAYLF